MRRGKQTRSVVENNLVCVQTRAAAIQTAAYQYAYAPTITMRRAAVQISSDGTYRIHPYEADLMDDLNVFMAALTLYSFKRANS